MDSAQLQELWSKLQKDEADSNEIQRCAEEFANNYDAGTTIRYDTVQMVNNVAINDINADYVYKIHNVGVEALFQGRYRDAFNYFHSALAHFSSNFPAWMRITEAIVYEYFEDELRYTEIYQKVFGEVKRSPRRAMNERTERHPLMTMEYAYQTSLVAMMLAHCGRSLDHIYRAALIHMFASIKTGRWSMAKAVFNDVFLLAVRTDSRKNSKSIRKLFDYNPDLIQKFDEMGQPPNPATEEVALFCMRRALNYLKEIGVVSRNCNKHEDDPDDMKSFGGENGLLEIVILLQESKYKEAVCKVQEFWGNWPMTRENQEALCVIGMHIAYKVEDDDLLKKFVAVLRKVIA